jgi:hypothetical protein
MAPSEFDDGVHEIARAAIRTRPACGLDGLADHVQDSSEDAAEEILLVAEISIEDPVG